MAVAGGAFSLLNSKLDIAILSPLLLESSVNRGPVQSPKFVNTLVLTKGCHLVYIIALNQLAMPMRF